MSSPTSNAVPTSGYSRYEKIKVIGRGSFGEVHLVKAKEGKHFCVIKEVEIHSLSQKEKEETLNEVKILSLVNHPNIIRYRKSFLENGKLCIVMDYAEGGDLYRRVQLQRRRKKYLKERVIVGWFLQICLALKHVHDRRILHRDLKTQNIFLSGDHEVIKLGDFGIAKVLQNTMDCASTMVGTPYYMSPEICQDQAYNGKSDVWSLGCILYELSTLRHAFDAREMKFLVLNILKGQYRPLPDFYSSSLRGLVDAMLQQDPNKRPSINDILALPLMRDQMRSYYDNPKLPFEVREMILPYLMEGAYLSPLEKPPALKNPLQYLRQQGRLLGAVDVQKTKNDEDSPKKQFKEKREPQPPSELKNIDSRAIAKGLVNPLVRNREGGKGEVPKSPEKSQKKTGGDGSVSLPSLSATAPKLHGTISATDSIFNRVEALRVYLATKLGEEALLKAYSILQNTSSEDDNDENDICDELDGVIPVEKRGYISLLQQMIFCESRVYSA